VNGITRAPVVDPDDPGHLVGMVSLAQLLHARRADHHEEHHRERHLSLRTPTATAATATAATATTPITTTAAGRPAG
jgi:hypothetical protein